MCYCSIVTHFRTASRSGRTGTVSSLRTQNFTVFLCLSINCPTPLFSCSYMSQQICGNKTHARELILLKQIQRYKNRKHASRHVWTEKSYISFRASINRRDSWKNWQSCEMTASRIYLDTTARRLYFYTRPLKGQRAALTSLLHLFPGWKWRYYVMLL